MSEVPKYLSVQEVADILKVHPKTVQNHLRRGIIFGSKVGKSWYVDPKELRRLLEPKSA